MDHDLTRHADLGPLYADHLRNLEGRLQGALEAGGFDALAVFAGVPRAVFRDDLTYPFRVEPYFKAWVPITSAPGSWLKLTPGRRPLLVYLQEEDFWHAPPREPAGYWVEHVEIRPVASATEALRALGGPRGRQVAIGEGIGHDAGFGAVNDPGVLAYLDYYRAYKTAYEVTCLRRAATTAAAGHLAVAQAFGPGASELELHQRYLEATAQREPELPYPSIVGLNNHACILHYQHLEVSAPDTLRSLLLDAGAEFAGYASDVTRTWTTDRSEFKGLIGSMEALQRDISARVRPGTDFVELNEETHRQLGGVLRHHGLITCSAERAHEQGITRAFLPHGLGHLLGLQVHDAGGHQIDPDGTRRAAPSAHPFLRLTRTLEPGFALTIEPGLYFIPALLAELRTRHRDAIDWAAVERLTPYGGIRIEDDVVVTDTEPENLSRDAFEHLSAHAEA